ncbi:DUF2723 domain-containing protein [Rudanella paleaurantiibacter]|uniref:DUF2723 domain-containing protein n=1 Tax=Rudanella paleaurantiibacter TaxID=2614655 RepID=A0A7J5U4B7_9BACT|nr:DUF2723 domain-containing protein [Rudanella paleaurantiibacter]KAB7732571.1 DUF2723 domain-containing protein [Rudanella paleaurantiibacter]
MQSFRRLNTIAGWATFAVALLTYSLTVERTASFWDCGEFIACAYKLQVPHPPGAPFFLLIGRIFSLLAGGDVTQVAFWINMVSVLASAFTILFLCWTISMLAQKLIGKPESEYNTADSLLVVGSAVVGALVYTFSDTFWFSAVEAEVYGMSSFFTAIVVWAAFRWERIQDEAAANRWLIFIAYLIGLSIGVHLLNLVTLPALALIYYFKKTARPTFKGGAIAFIIGFAVLGVINAGIIPGLPSAAFVLEKFFVNTLGMPFSTGMTVFAVLFFAALIYALFWSNKNGRVYINTALLGLAFVLVGYISYIQVLVRSDFNPPINENDPSDALNFISYLKREQYGSRSLTYGPVFTSRPVDQKPGDPLFKKEGNKYVEYGNSPKYVYEPGDEMLFPRVYSSQQNHPQLYRQMLGLAEGQKPTFGDNLEFFFNYQLGHMYWRYLMWNFSGRESDQEGAGYLLPWSTDEGAPELLKTNKARDNFYMLPFLLGLFGIVFQYYRNRRDFLIVGLLFLFTGIALQVFLNSPPSEPRERDYIYVASYYFFAIWVGLGVMALAEGLRQYLKSDMTRNGAIVGLSLLVPVMMGAKSWDNHDRSNRYHSVDFAKNLLNSCAPNAILFTGGDNDTFPLWYAQEVEGFRRDVRVCNLSLLGTEWYIQQMKRKTYESEALPISLEFDQFNKGENDVIPFYEMSAVKDGIDLKQYINLVKQGSQAVRVPLTTGEMTSILPSSVLFLPIDKAAVDKANFVPSLLRPLVGDTLQWTIGKRDLYKPDLIMLDIIATNNWQRPIYFSSTLASDNYLNLKDHMQVEGYAYRLMPVRVDGASDGFVNTDIAANNLMKRSFWREMNNPNTYYDETYKGSPVLTARIAFFRLADQLIREGKKAEAKKVLDYSLSVIPDSTIPFDQISSNFVQLYFNVGDTKKALEIADTMVTRIDQNLTYNKTSGRQFGDVRSDLYSLNSIVEACKEAKQDALAQKYEALLEKHYSAYGG